MKGALRVRNAGPEGIRLTIGPVWAELTEAEALEMWKALGQELGILCKEHRLETHQTPAAKCEKCKQLVELAR